MNWQNFIRGLITSTLIFGAILLFLTLLSAPENSATIVLYFVSLFFFLVGIAAISGFYFRKWWTHNELIFENVKISTRQAILFSFFCLALLALSAARLLNWWDGVILAVSFVLIEMYFKTRE